MAEPTTASDEARQDRPGRQPGPAQQDQPVPAHEPAPLAQPAPADLRGALLRYRVMAYVVGVGLVVLVGVGIPLQIFAHRETVVEIVGTAHGYLYMVYAVLAFDLARRAHWPIGRTVAVIAAGTVPFLSFYGERRVTRWIRTER